jgi:Fe-S-cluster containining protein
MSDLAKIRQRETDPAVLEHAQRVSDKIVARVDQQRVQLFGAMAKQMPHLAGKVDMLRRMSGELATAARDLVPCSRGCSHCCHMATMLSQEEAEVIAAETGAPLATPSAWFTGADERNRYDGIPCPFLKDSKCSIYEHRPVACRLHVHLDRDNTLCQIIPGEPIQVPRLDTLRFDLNYVSAFGDPLNAKLADIREFFPNGLAK